MPIEILLIMDLEAMRAASPPELAKLSLMLYQGFLITPSVSTTKE